MTTRKLEPRLDGDKVTMRTTCEKGHTVRIKSVREWYFSSSADFCSRKLGKTLHGKPSGLACEARVAKREYLATDGRWYPIPED